MAKPLADRMRPETLDEYIGQKHIVGEGKLLRRAIEADMLKSIILFGPAGTGKTSLANVISNITKATFVQLNATTAAKSNVVTVIDNAKKMRDAFDRRTILFIDEIHRFNKGQQDTLLPAVEDGTIILIGATTENPFFEVNEALLSRSVIFKLEPLNLDDVKSAILSALSSEKGLKEYNVELTDEALSYIAETSGGDIRRAFNAVELAVLTSQPVDGKIIVDLQTISDSMQVKPIRYDKGGSNHYDVVSAFCKSLRGGDSTAALHYFARMIEAGEDPKFIMRRVITHSAEDVGLANPQALQVAIAAFQALEVIGMPEARLPMAEAIIYICESPKSNSTYKAINQAFNDVKKLPLKDVPIPMRDAHYPGANELGHGDGYLYPHNVPGGWIPQQYAPDNIHGKEYYKPTGYGHESQIKKYRDGKAERYNKLLGE